MTTLTFNIKTPDRFYSLDVVRGIAALGVVFWHWHHFFYNGTQAGAFDQTAQPLYSVFWVLYDQGWIAVDFFFSLSGFIFFWLYAGKIREKKISAWNFGVLRFSRLYPLHFMTLIFVLIGQRIAYSLNGHYVVYAFNNLYHFILNLFFATYWGLQRGWSFNAPIWSVSVEVLLYIVFFIVSFYGGTRSIPVVLILSLSGLFIPMVGRGFFSFYLGGIMFMLYQKIVTLKPDPKLVMIGASGVVGLWIITILGMKYDFISYLPKQVAVRFNGALYATGVLFPLTILLLALVETYRGTLGKRIRFLGDISYSSYLIHFPLQLVFILIFPYLNLDKSFFYTNTALLLYFLPLLALSFLSYHKLERPAQKYLRNNYLRPSPAPTQ